MESIDVAYAERKGIAGVGISFGVDRIYDVMEELSLFPENLNNGTSVLFFNMGAEESVYAYCIMNQLRDAGISCEIFHEPAKLDKQFKYAERRKIPFVVIIGTRELETRSFIRKDLRSGIQETHPMDSLGQLNWA